MTWRHTPNRRLALCFYDARLVLVCERAGATSGPGRRAQWYQLQHWRGFGPAVGGIVVVSAGAVAAFALNPALYVPLNARPVGLGARGSQAPDREAALGALVVNGVRDCGSGGELNLGSGRERAYWPHCLFGGWPCSAKLQNWK